MKSRHGTVALLFSAAVNITLAWQVLSLRHSVQLTQAGDRLLAGESLPKLALVDADGTQVEVGGPGAVSYLLYVVAPGCSWCEKNNAAVRYLAKSVGKEYHFVGISTRPTGLRELAEHLALGFPIYGDPAGTVLRALKVGGTPTMISLNSDGRVDRAWQGFLGAKGRADVGKYFGITLSGFPGDEPDDQPEGSTPVL